MTFLNPDYIGLHDRNARSPFYVIALLRFVILKKQHMYRFFPFGFINSIIFVINPCGSYSRFVGEESCVKVWFESSGSKFTNLRSITYLDR